MTRTASSTPATVTELAIRKGFPKDLSDQLHAILTKLDLAETHAAIGEPLEEESALRAALDIVSTTPILKRRKVSQWLDTEASGRIAAGRLRIGAELIGVVGDGLIVYSDRVLYGDQRHLVDSQVQVSVAVDGQFLQTSRPTLTRMALGSVLPGSALLVGLATPKTTTDDRRTAAFIVAHPKWTIEVALDPDKAGETRGIAARLSAVVDGLQEEQPANPSNPLDEQISQLERIAALEASGSLTAEQASQMRDKIVAQ